MKPKNKTSFEEENVRKEWENQKYNKKKKKHPKDYPEYYEEKWN